MKKSILEKLMKGLFLIASLICIVCVILIILFLLINSIPAFSKIGIINFISGKIWSPGEKLFGVFPMIVGSLFVTAGAIIIGVPIGFFTAVFMAKFCPKHLYKILFPSVNLLAGIPSIIFGFFGLVFLAPFIRENIGGSGKGLLTAIIILTIMILPTIITISESSIKAVPSYYFEGALALGTTKERAVFSVVCLAAKSGIVSSIILGIGRVIGETMAVVMVVGNQPILPESITGGLRTLTTNIVLEMGYAGGLHRQALIATAVVLIVFVLILNVVLSLVKRKGYS